MTNKIGKNEITTLNGDHKEEPPRAADASSPIWHSIIAGGVAGAGSRIVTAPLDLIRIRRQLAPRTLYPSESLLQSWIMIVKNEGGIQALYRGNVAAIYLWIGYSSVQFALYKQSKAYLNTQSIFPSMLPFVTTFMSGAFAGTIATVATYPFDVCRTTFAARGTVVTETATESAHKVPFHSLMEPRLHSDIRSPSASSHSPPRTLMNFAVELYKSQGVRGFYAGIAPAIVQIVPYMGINFAIYDYLTSNANVTSFGGSALSGSISGSLSKLFVYPMDTIKRRIQAQAFFGDQYSLSTMNNTTTTLTSSQQRPYYTSTIHCAEQIFRNEGFSSFYRGAVPSVLKSTISSALSFGLYRSTHNLLERFHHR